MIARRKELFTEHRCRPFLTMAIPPLTQLPMFVGSSMLLSRLSQPPTVFDSEAFFTLTSLAHTDPTATLPIALGLITLVNVESSRWFVSVEGKERQEQEQRRIAEKRAKGEIVLEPQKIVQSGLRLLSVGRILIGAVVPGVSTCILSLSFQFFFRVNKKFHCSVFDADFVSCAVSAERGAVLGLVGDLRSLSVLGIRLLGQTKIQPAEIASVCSTPWLRQKYR
jgi:hypothetical protein